MKKEFSGLALALCILLTAAFAAGCSSGEPTEQVASTSGDNGQPTEQATSTSGDNGQPTEQATSTSGGNVQPTEQATSTSGGNVQPTRQSMPQEPETGHIEYMVKLLALRGVNDYWFLDLASISADPELAPLSQNLTDTWNGWNQHSSDEFGLTLQDAAFAVSLPGEAVFLGGIEDVEGLRETVAGLGYQEQESAGVVYWLSSSEKWDQDWQGFTFLPNGVVMIVGNDPAYFMEGGVSAFLLYDSYWDEGRDWQYYLEDLGVGQRDSAWDIGSMDDVVSDIQNSLLFHFDYGDAQSMWAKAGAGTVRETMIMSFADDESAKLEETEYRETLSQVQAEAERVKTEKQGEETDEERFIREYLAACSNQEVDRSGKELTRTQDCLIDWFDFRYANYLLALR